MKLTIFFIFFASLLVGTKVFAQKVTLNEYNANLEKIFKEISFQTEYTFLYENKVLDKANPITLKVNNASIEQVLNLCFKKQPLIYKIVNNTIVIKEKSSQLELSKEEILSLKNSVKGKITNPRGEPLVGVSVIVKGGNTGTITDESGNYFIDVPSDGILVFSYVGFTTREIPVNGSSTINKTLQESISGLNQVIVIGYGRQKISDITGAVSSIKAEELPLAANTSIEQMLSGKVSGLSVMQTDPQPGGGVNLQIRGAAGSSNEPLYVVDGFPLSGNAEDPGVVSRYSTGYRSPLNSLNPNDIESIEILKDVSATSIYGARAANGVILITTKSGSGSTPEIRYDFKQSVSTIARKLDVMNAYEYMDASNKYSKERWKVENKLDVYGNVDPSTVAPWTPVYTEAQIQSIGDGTDWFSEVTRNGLIQEHNLSLGGGLMDKSKYFISGNYFDQAGLVKNNDLRRFTGRINIEQQVRSWLKFGILANGSKIDINNPTIANAEYRGLENAGPLEASFNFQPTLPILDSQGNPTVSPYGIPNPVSMLDIVNKTNQDRVFVQSFLELNPIKNLRIRTQVGIDKQQAVTSFYLPKTVPQGAVLGGQSIISQGNSLDQLLNTTINYNWNISEKQNLHTMIGYEYQKFDNNGHSLNNNNFLFDRFTYNDIGSGTGIRPSVSSYKTEDMLASYFGRLNYNFQNKYLVTFSIRADGSTKFGEGNKFGYFPSGAVAWRVSNEQFMEKINWISNLKLRLSAGQTGNSNISGAYGFYRTGGNYNFGSVINPGVILAAYSNDDLKWETTTSVNLGIDFGFIKDRISASIDYFDSRVSGLLSNRTLSTYQIVSSIADNIGKTSSRGLEATINTVNTEGKLNWTSRFIVSAYRDRWVERNPEVVLNSYQSQNDPIRVIWGYQERGLIKPGESVPHMPGAYPGSVYIVDINGYDSENKLTGAPDGKINNADIVKIANSDPDFMFGFTNDIKYKGFDFNMHLYGMIGRLKRNPYFSLSTNLMDISRWNYPSFVAKGKYWSSENQNATLPNVYVTHSYPGATQYAMQRADFLRAKNITIGYTLSTKGKFGSNFKNLRIYLDIANAFIITPYSQLDPEYNDGSPRYPTNRAYTMGVSVTF